MIDPKLKAKILVQALVRHCTVAMIPAYVTLRGDPDSGSVLIKRTSSTMTCVVFQLVFGEDGQRQWIAATGDTLVSEADADAFIARQSKYDDDLWVVEVEAPETWLPTLS